MPLCIYRPWMWHIPLVPVDLPLVSVTAALGRLLQAQTYLKDIYFFFLPAGLLWTSLLPGYIRESITQGTFTPLEMKQMENDRGCLDGCSMCFSGEPAGLSPGFSAVMLTVPITLFSSLLSHSPPSPTGSAFPFCKRHFKLHDWILSPRGWMWMGGELSVGQPSIQNGHPHPGSESQCGAV